MNANTQSPTPADYIALTDLRSSLPTRGGKRLGLATVYRWIGSGCRAPDGSRVRLRSIRIGGRTFVTRAWVDEFFLALTPNRTEADKPATTRSREVDLAEAECRSHGI